MKTTSRTARAFFRVPAGTKPGECKYCRMAVYWVQINGFNKPIDCSAIGGNEPSEAKDPKQLGLFGEQQVRDGKGVNHLEDCKFRGDA